MRRSIGALALAASVSMAWCASASAQDVGVDLYVGPSAAYDPYYDYPAYRGYGYGPPAYGYYYERDDRHLRRPEDYRTGSRRWWKQMDREGRAGQQE